MNLINMFETQRKFDSTFADVDKATKIKNKFFALLVEQGEAANEAPHIFKYWSSNPKGSSLKTAEKFAKYYNLPMKPIEGDPLLEELVDKLHFILSLGNELNLNGVVKSYSFIRSNDIVDMEMHFTRYVSALYFIWKNSCDDLSLIEHAKESYGLLLAYFFGIASELGYNETSLEEAYYDKNKINYARQSNGY